MKAQSKCIENFVLCDLITANQALNAVLIVRQLCCVGHVAVISGPRTLEGYVGVCVTERERKRASVMTSTPPPTQHQ